MLKSVVGAAFVAACSLVMSDTASAANYDPTCQCSRPRPRPVARYTPPPRGDVCVTACMTPSDWAQCATKSWYADSKDRSIATPRFTSRCGTVCKPYNSPRLGYRAASGNWVVFRFGPNS